jgi:hypothetical protein
LGRSATEITTNNLGQLSGVCPVHFAAYGMLIFIKTSEVRFVRRVKYRLLWH